MKVIALLILLVSLVVGTYLTKAKSHDQAGVLIEDSVGSQLAAPVKGQEHRADIPL